MEAPANELLHALRERFECLLRGEPAGPVEIGTAGDADARWLAETLNRFLAEFAEAREFVLALAAGNLDVAPPPRNLVASPFKQLHAALAHLTWQTRQVAAGDYSQRVEFLGDFSTAFNAMIAALRESQDRARQAEQALLRAAEDLQRSNKDLEQFAYTASHDLQEPLRMISGFLQLLADRYAGQLDAKGQQFIAYAVDGAHRMSDMLRDLLAYSRVDRKAAPQGPVDADRALDAALANLAASIREANAKVTRDPLPALTADSTQLTQLFQNLVGNAVKFRSPARPCLVHVGAERQNSQWVVLVRDNGIGIPRDQQERVFEIFQRLHTREKYPGTGIGLAICKKIVDRHGGRIWVQSEPGEGATFYFALPGHSGAG